MFGTTWFIPVYTTILPWASVLRIWDMFLCEGNEKKKKNEKKASGS